MTDDLPTLATGQIVPVAVNSKHPVDASGSTNGNCHINYHWSPTGDAWTNSQWDCTGGDPSLGLERSLWALTNYDQLWPIEVDRANDAAGTSLSYTSDVPPGGVHIGILHGGLTTVSSPVGYDTNRMNVTQDNVRSYASEYINDNGLDDKAKAFGATFASSVYRRIAAATWR
jgi:hypothetical protein